MNCLYSHEGGAYCDKHDHGAVSVGCCGKESCPDRKVLTNADRIRAMSDEELADWVEILLCPSNCPDEQMGEACARTSCDGCWLSWLKATAEVDE